ncbi:MAG: hypothetical protein BJ554DRAFT_8008 [Olpidium bornovanus]|uniref:Uncharacterized protein n=1 Tax=Olpidium bornovanus TaxID=278681 RepID=A0A8H7ZV26_9FUNG|nr:MAG: hypothetical protein BJ554DRAFT_8008 [Olpidium bornovanus]
MRKRKKNALVMLPSSVSTNYPEHSCLNIVTAKEKRRLGESVPSSSAPFKIQRKKGDPYLRLNVFSLQIGIIAAISTQPIKNSIKLGQSNWKPNMGLRTSRRSPCRSRQ